MIKRTVYDYKSDPKLKDIKEISFNSQVHLHELNQNHRLLLVLDPWKHSLFNLIAKLLLRSIM